MFQSSLSRKSPRGFIGGHLSKRLYTWIHPFCISDTVEHSPWCRDFDRTGKHYLGKIVSVAKNRPRDHFPFKIKNHREQLPVHIPFFRQMLQTLFHKWCYNKLNRYRKWVHLHQRKGRSCLHRLFHPSWKVNCQYPMILSLDCIIYRFFCPGNIFKQSKSDYSAIDSVSFTQEIDCFIYGAFRIYVNNSSRIRIEKIQENQWQYTTSRQLLEGFCPERYLVAFI